MKTLPLILLLFCSAVSSEEIMRTYTVKTLTASQTVEEYLSSFNKEEILKLARGDAGKLYLNTNKLENDKFSSNLEVISSAYIRIEDIKNSVKNNHQVTTANVFINDDFIEYQLSALDKVSHLTSKVEIALERLSSQKKASAQKNFNLTLKSIIQAESELEFFQLQLKQALQAKSWLKKEDSTYVMNNTEYQYSISEKLFAMKLSQIWLERAIQTIVLPLKEKLNIRVTSARMKRSYYKDNTDDSDEFIGDPLLGGYSDKVKKNINDYDDSNLDILLSIEHDKEVFSLLDEWFIVDEPTNELTVKHTFNNIENLAKEILLNQLKEIPFDSIVKVNENPIAIISTNITGKNSRLTLDFWDSYRVVSLPLNTNKGSTLHLTSKKSDLYILSVLMIKKELLKLARLNNIKITSTNLTFIK